MRKGRPHIRQRWTFGRGMWPLEAIGQNLISYALVERMWGEWIFEAGTAVDVMSVDPAHEGGDLAIACMGKYGLASGMRTLSNEIIRLVEPRWALQIHQFHSLKKGMVKATSDQIRALAKRYGVSPRFIAIDKTGIGYGCYCDLVLK
jgi:hypothetical protein